MTEILTTREIPPVSSPASTESARSGGFSIAFFVPGQPVAKGRPIAGRGFNGRTTLRTPEKTVNYESLVALACRDAMGEQKPHEGPLTVIFDISVQIPSSWSAKRHTMAVYGRIAATKKPDIDNIVKALCDAMNGIAYRDDSQIVQMYVIKKYAEQPGVLVNVKAMDKEPA